MAQVLWVFFYSKDLCNLQNSIDHVGFILRKLKSKKKATPIFKAHAYFLFNQTSNQKTWDRVNPVINRDNPRERLVGEICYNSKINSPHLSSSIGSLEAIIGKIL